MSFHVLEILRIGWGALASDSSDGNNGAFELEGSNGRTIFAIASDGHDWEHVSVTVLQGKKNRMPTWEEMARVKAAFWDTEDAVMQLHPPESDYVNAHPLCLHLWRPTQETIPLPPSWMVGPRKGETVEQSRKRAQDAGAA